jgi:hypothetical protein
MDHRRHVVNWGAGNPRVRTSPTYWKQPLKWNRNHDRNQRAWDNMKSKFGLSEQALLARGFVKPRRRRVFCASLADVFDNELDPHKQNGEWVSVSEVEGSGKHYTFPDGRTVRRVGKLAAGRTLDGKIHNEFPGEKAHVG